MWKKGRKDGFENKIINNVVLKPIKVNKIRLKSLRLKLSLLTDNSINLGIFTLKFKYLDPQYWQKTVSLFTNDLLLQFPQLTSILNFLRT